MSDDARHALILPFDTPSPDFARGFEAGRLWEQLKADPDAELEQMVHVANAEMVLRIAEALHRPVTSEEHDEHWMTVSFAPAEEASDAA